MSAYANPSAAPAPPPEQIAPRPVKAPEKQGFGKKKWLVPAIVIVVAAAVWLLLPKARQRPVATAVIRTARVTRGPLERTLRAAGTTSARNYANIAAPMMRGREANAAMVLLFLAKSGSIVKKGDVIAQIDAQAMKDHIDDMNAQVVQLDANMRKRESEQAIDRENLQQNVRRAKAAWDKAKLDYGAQEIRTAIDQEQLKLTLEEAEAAYNEQIKDVPIKEASFASDLHIQQISRDRTARHRDRHKIDVERFTIQAPIAGLVVMQSIFRGGDMGQVQEGDQVSPGQPFMKLVDIKNMQVEATVNQTESEGLRIGQRAEINFDAFPELHLTGKVYAVGALAIGSRIVNYYVRNVPVRVQIEGYDARVIPDLSASADIILERKDDVLRVPLEAVHAAGGKSVVYLKQGDGFRAREVQLGLRSQTHVEITAGLQGGEEIALQKPDRI